MFKDAQIHDYVQRLEEKDFSSKELYEEFEKAYQEFRSKKAAYEEVAKENRKSKLTIQEIRAKKETIPRFREQNERLHSEQMVNTGSKLKGGLIEKLQTENENSYFEQAGDIKLK